MHTIRTFCIHNVYNLQIGMQKYDPPHLLKTTDPPCFLFSPMGGLDRLIVHVFVSLINRLHTPTHAIIIGQKIYNNNSIKKKMPVSVANLSPLGRISFIFSFPVLRDVVEIKKLCTSPPYPP